MTQGTQWNSYTGLPNIINRPYDTDGSAMLFRYTVHGEFAGDTWHPTVEGAREHAIYDYSDALDAWIDVPNDVPDAHAFAIHYAAERLNSTGDR